jgi:hypothetical protein
VNNEIALIDLKKVQTSRPINNNSFINYFCKNKASGRLVQFANIQTI